MLLRESGRHTGDEYDLTAMAGEGAAGGGVAAGEALARYAETFCEDRDGFAAARGRLLGDIGAEALVDAAGVLAIFTAVVRVADATGIPLEEEKARTSADFRGALGIDDYPAAAGKV